MNIKTPKILLFYTSALCCTVAMSAQDAFREYAPVKINQTEEATFPMSLVAVGIKSGAATLAIAIDDRGQLTDYLVTGYTHPAFAERAVAALKKWTFEPARIHGSPRNSKADLSFKFEVEGVVVVSLTIVSYNELVHFKMAPRSMAYTARTLAELDRIPNPIKVVKPTYPNSVARSSRGGHVAVEFYIDEKGRVRMPSVSRETNEANEELAAIAVTTVGQWQFEPPMAKGYPVLVVAQQDFDFKPASSE